MKPVRAYLVKVVGVAGCLIGALVANGQAPAPVKTFSASEEAKIGKGARQFLANIFISNLNLMTNYPDHQPKEAIDDHLEATMREALSSPNVQLFNEFNGSAAPFSTLPQYVKDCRVRTNGRPLKHTLALDSARYIINRSPQNQYYVDVYTIKVIEGKNKKKEVLDQRNPVQMRVSFTYDAKQKFPYNFKLEGIDRVVRFPREAKALSNEPIVDAIDFQTVGTSLVGQLATSLPIGTRQIALKSFTYKNCGITNSLSDRLYAALNSQFPTRTGVVVVEDKQDEQSLQLRGVYEENINNLSIEAVLYDPVQKKELARVQNAQLPLTYLSASNVELIPEGFGTVNKISDTLDRTKLPTHPSLKVELMTNRGREGAEFWQGDTLRLQVKANRPCYLRLINMQSKGALTVMKENFRIKPGEENQYISLEPFTCEEPFGTEFVAVYASEKPLNPIPRTPNQTGYVRVEDGYPLFVGTLENFIRLSASTQEGTVAQDRIQLTTRQLKKPKK